MTTGSGPVDRSRDTGLRDIDATLRQHPGVREVAVILREDKNSGEPRFTAFVVPNDDYVDRVFGGPENERKRLQRWRKTYDLTQFGKEAKSSQPGFDIAGWHSSYTRRPIPAEEMREWVDITVSEIASLHPGQVLELGCGTGLLLLRLAPHCERYVGIDFSPAVLQKIRRQMEELGGSWDAVTLLERSADNLEGFPENSFDTVIINSAAQYFPGLSYLTRVLEKATKVVKPGGRIFVGDLRNLALLEPYAVSVELYQASPSMTIEELRKRVRRRMRFEEQLVISPAFFLALPKQFPKISSVEIRPKRGRFDNEMTRFRYDAILDVEVAPEKVFDVAWQDWTEQNLTLEVVAGKLRDHRPENLALARVPNGRIQRDLEAFTKLANSPSLETIDAFKESIEGLDHRGIDPQQMRALGEELGYHVDISWAASRSDGSYDVLFRREASIRSVIQWPQAPSMPESPIQYSNSPGRAVLHEDLMAQLVNYSRKHLPASIVPAAFIALDGLPLTPDGALDVAALLPPEL